MLSDYTTVEGFKELILVPDYVSSSTPTTTSPPTEENDEDDDYEDDYEGDYEDDYEDDDEEEEEEEEQSRKPTVLISGGGIAGLTLALLLHKARVPFLVFERAKEVKPLGSYMCLGALVGPVFKQLGIYDEFVQMSKRQSHVQMYTENLKPVKSMDISLVKD
ncbi:hypothetical protein BGZ94_005879, partial [Podila epigama]